MKDFHAVTIRALLYLPALGIVAGFVFGCSAPRSQPLISATDLATQTPLPSDTPAPSTGGEAEAPPDIFGFEYNGVVKFAHWDDPGIELENFIVGYAMVQGYVYDFEPVALRTREDSRSALEDGSVDVVLEMSRTEARVWYENIVRSGAVLDLGSLYGDNHDLRIAARADLLDRAPELVELLRKMSPGKETLDALKARLTGGRLGVKPNAAALIFYKDHEDRWTQWMTPEAVAGVKDALAKNITSLHKKCLLKHPGAIHCK